MHTRLVMCYGRGRRFAAWKVAWELMQHLRPQDRVVPMIEQVSALEEDADALEFWEQVWGLPVWCFEGAALGHQAGNRLWATTVNVPQDGFMVETPRASTLVGDAQWEWRHGGDVGWVRPRPLRTLGEWGDNGTVKTEYYDVLAHYYAKYVSAYASHGVHIDFLECFNEPYDSYTDMDASQLATFLGKHVGPLFAKLGLHPRTKLTYGGQAERWSAAEFVPAVMADARARR